jgi:hypothetical protein
MSTVMLRVNRTLIAARPVSASWTTICMNGTPKAFVPNVGGGHSGGRSLKLPKFSPSAAATASLGMVTVYVNAASATVAPPAATDWSTVLPDCV